MGFAKATLNDKDIGRFEITDLTTKSLPIRLWLVIIMGPVAILVLLVYLIWLNCKRKRL